MTAINPSTSGRLRATTIRRNTLSDETRRRMWTLFRRYYDAVNEEAFYADLDEKSHVVLLRDSGDGSLRGFSTLLLEHESLGGRRINVLFSGDTVIEREYWGDRALQKAFVRYLVRCRLNHPFTPLYWLLLTKGYKTYLLLTRNFPTHYPRASKPTPPQHAQLIARVCRRRYGAAFRASEGVVRFERSHGQLKRELAPINPPLLDDPDIAFFNRRNPRHLRGDELACVGAATFWMFLRFCVRVVLRPRRRPVSKPALLAGEVPLGR